MDLADIKRKAQAAREFQVASGGLTFTLRMPTSQEVDVVLARVRLHEGADDPAVLVRLRRGLMEAALVAWVGVTCEHLAPGAGADVADLVPGAAELFFDNPANKEASDLLFQRFIDERKARIEKQGTAEKN